MILANKALYSNFGLNQPVMKMLKSLPAEKLDRIRVNGPSDQHSSYNFLPFFSTLSSDAIQKLIALGFRFPRTIHFLDDDEIFSIVLAEA